jgi:hypothetical protein
MGSTQPLVRPKPNRDNFLLPEAEVLDGANRFIAEHYGAQFTVDLFTGTLTSVPFKTSGFRVIESLGKEARKSLVLTNDRGVLKEGHAVFAYRSSRTKTYDTILSVAPPVNGERIFQYMTPGETLLGRCYLAD